MTDPIADMLTRIRNAQMVKKSEVVLPFSKLKLHILELLAKQGWIAAVEKIEPVIEKSIKAKFKKSKDNTTSRFAQLKVKIKYNSDKTPKIQSLKRISKPGRRVYVAKDNLPIVLNNKGLAIISTSQGLLTNQQAREQKVGGEVVCEIY